MDAVFCLLKLYALNNYMAGNYESFEIEFSI